MSRNKFDISIQEAELEYIEKLDVYKNYDVKSQSDNRLLRRINVFCVGSPKSGTHSMAAIFKNFNSYHECDNIFMITLLDKVRNKQITVSELNFILKTRDYFNNLEMDSSHFSGNFVSEIGNIIPSAKFILTLRDCVSWMDSWFNHQLSMPKLHPNLVKDLGRRLYYDRGHKYTKYDKHLEQHRLYPVRSYLEFWSAHNTRVINCAKPDALLIVKTCEIAQSLESISSFLQIESTLLNAEGTHEGKTKGRFDILKTLDSNYLMDVATEVCGELNAKYFGENSITNAIAQANE